MYPSASHNPSSPTPSSSPAPATVQPARPPSLSWIPVSSSLFLQSNLPPPPTASSSAPPSMLPATGPGLAPPYGSNNIAAAGFGSAPNTLTELVQNMEKRDLTRIVKLVVFLNPFREDPDKALRDWDLWGLFFFIVFLGLIFSWSASVKKVSLTSNLWILTSDLGSGAHIWDLGFLILVCRQKRHLIRKIG
ncbi:unnamed protein product [Linum tenue]|uniref:Uncharacterized protein n=1 Tax=Linum tenue TaxID=586396 RepID=A0AAV0QXG9_9ROSI|nr:unnamed protein product [Linum tenue]